MDSDESRDASSAAESEHQGSKSSRSGSRSASPHSDPPSAKSPPRSRSSSGSRSPSLSRPKTPDSASSDSNPPFSPGPKSPPKGHGPRSPSLSHSAASSRSSSPEGPRSPDADDDKQSVKSGRSSSKSVSLGRASAASARSEESSRGSGNGKRSDGDDGNSSDSSAASVDSSSRKNKNISKVIDTQAEEISDGDMESDQEKDIEKPPAPSPSPPPKEPKKKEICITHEDLSDVSDLDESIGGHSDIDEDGELSKKNDDSNGPSLKEELELLKSPEKPTRPEDGEEQLDFEAEDGECDVDEKPEEKKDSGSIIEEGETVDAKEKEREELEEGEVSDEDEARPEETEPRPVCRFFSRGQCTWGASCRFLHPGVTDKGNYTMFEMIRPVVPGEFGREDRNYGRPGPDPAPVESAWERGLRTAKEMVRKSIKRKEQDIDFEEKKMNLSLAQEEFDKENGYYGRVASPEPRYVRHVPVEYPPVVRPPPEEYFGRRQVVYESLEFAPPARERVRPSYRELPSHRMPDFYNNKYEDEQAASSAAKARKPKREVIVQRAPEDRPVRGDEWSDPWMRSKSPAGRKASAGRKRSYSSGSSYSSSSSSRSSSESSRSSLRSRSRSNNKRPPGAPAPRPHKSRHVSPSVIVSERKAANERAALMNPPAPRKRAPSPSVMRTTAANPPAPPTKEDQFGRTRNKIAIAAALARVKGRRRSSKSSSDSSGSSSSDSDSSGSSSSTSRDGSSPGRAVDISIAKAMNAALKNSSSEKRQIKLNLKNPNRKPDISDIARKTEALAGKKRPASSPPPLDPKSKKATSRREELLKQLKAVEDAIAKKRSKV